ncbi:MAG: 2-hydroxyacid dehydrogenase [Chitinophagaceae bacterium]|nr:2-hydroxyacid dehydrogenase [Chitinophagaceae bacterium]
MRILVFSAKEFEISYLNKANHIHFDVEFANKQLDIETAALAKGFNCISIFTNDDCSAAVLNELHLFGVKYIAVRAAGFDNVDIHEAGRLGMHVANVPEYSPYSIAEHAVGMLLTLVRKITTANEQVHANNFSLNNLVGFDLHGKRVGLIGTGRIGSIMAKILHGFGCEILAYDIAPSQDLSEKYGVRYCALNELSLTSDIISIHTPLNEQTRYLLNKSLFASMKKGVIIINTARGGVVNTSDLITYLRNGIIAAYGMDVYEKEKGIFFFDHSLKGIADPMLKELLSMKNVLVTPHQAFATREALMNIATTTFSTILTWSAGVRPDNELTHEPVLSLMGNK